jgi:hypothetical protein
MTTRAPRATRTTMQGLVRTLGVAAMAGAFALGMPAANEAFAQGPVGNQGGGSTPFSNITRRPAMSPYMGLAFQGNNPDTGGTLGAMQGLVRPQQQQFAQQQQAARQSRQLSQLQGQMRRIQRPAGGTTIQTIRATGHASTYMDLSHFYPSAR